MRNTIEVDQSVKIEQSGPTVLALANGSAHAIIIPSDVKHKALHALHAFGKTKDSALIIVFAACLSLLLEQYLTKSVNIVIDVEYQGKNEDVKAALLRFIRKTNPHFDSERVWFAHIGKHSPADRKARQVRAKRDKDYRKISFVELKRVLFGS